MNTTATDLPNFLWKPAVTEPTQRDLFGESEAPQPQAASLFADVVFDRPLDHAYTYAVPNPLRDAVAVGKRVQAPFGRGDKTTVGYCVRLSPTAPERPVKELVRVLDDEALLTPDLLRLTRWMADYYLCGWGQVLNAVIPAGARSKAGTRNLTLVEGPVVEVAEEVLRGGEPRLLHFGIADEEAWDVGLPCGGEIDVWVERYEP